MLNNVNQPLTTVRIILLLELYQVRNSTYYATYFDPSLSILSDYCLQNRSSSKKTYKFLE